MQELFPNHFQDFTLLKIKEVLFDVGYVKDDDAATQYAHGDCKM